MNKLEFKPNIENKKIILNEWDRKILLEGSKSVVDKILKEFRGKLPDAIIYPDTSARPLSYLFDPIFTKISKENNLVKPQSYFMKIEKADINTTSFEDMEGKELFYDEIKERFYKNIEFQEEYFEYPKNLIEYQMNNLEKAHENRAIAQDRALEINNYNEKLSGKGVIANLAVIDEFSNTGGTFKEIQYAFGENIPYFSVFGFNSENHVQKENIGLLIDREEYSENPSTKNHTKLTYTTGVLKRSIGVNKKNDTLNKYSEVNKNQTPEDKEMMKTLRKEMKELGEQIAQKY